jgi:cytochrome c oxidase assembly protein subunit 15
MKKLVLASIFLALLIIILSAYMRLMDAGLGCPDWPGCYGTLVVPQSVELVENANQAFPERPLEAEKAWNEMIHRYFAAGLGFFIVVIFFTSVAKKMRGSRGPVKLPFLILVLACFQGALAMWTVTLNLIPVVVMGHLLAGFAVLSCLFLLYLRLTPYRIPGGDAQIRPYAKFGALGIAIVVWQIALGGWTSANYASLACTELPICEGDWFGNLDIVGAFSVPFAENYEFGVHDYQERATMHVMHRIGAIITFIYLCWLAITLYKRSSSGLVKRLATMMTLVLGAQVLLGVSNVVYSLPLTVAVLHNAVAACLLLVMVLLTYTMYRKY